MWRSATSGPPATRTAVTNGFPGGAVEPRVGDQHGLQFEAPGGSEDHFLHILGRGVGVDPDLHVSGTLSEEKITQ